jgi:hypothetical protein
VPKSVVSCLHASDTTRSAVLWNAFEKHPDSFIAHEILCSSSQLRHESFMLHEKGFPFCVRFSSLSRTADVSTYLTPLTIRLQLVTCLNNGPRRYPSPDQNRFQSLAALFILETASSNPLTLAVCLHYVSLLRHNMNQTLRFNQKPESWHQKVLLFSKLF